MRLTHDYMDLYVTYYYYHNYYYYIGRQYWPSRRPHTILLLCTAVVVVRLPPRSGSLAVHQRMRVRRQHHLFGLAADTGLLVGARFAVPDQHGHGDPPRRRQSVSRGCRVMVHVHALLLLRPFSLVPVILEPDFHLKHCKTHENVSPAVVLCYIYMRRAERTATHIILSSLASGKQKRFWRDFVLCIATIYR